MKIDNALAKAEAVVASLPEGTFLTLEQLLLLDIARSQREANNHAQEGLAWSKSLASLLEQPQ